MSTFSGNFSDKDDDKIWRPPFSLIRQLGSVETKPIFFYFPYELTSKVLQIF